MFNTLRDTVNNDPLAQKIYNREWDKDIVITKTMAEQAKLAGKE